MTTAALLQCSLQVLLIVSGAEENTDSLYTHFKGSVLFIKPLHKKVSVRCPISLCCHWNPSNFYTTIIASRFSLIMSWAGEYTVDFIYSFQWKLVLKASWRCRDRNWILTQSYQSSRWETSFPRALIGALSPRSFKFLHTPMEVLEAFEAHIVPSKIRKLQFPYLLSWICILRLCSYRNPSQFCCSLERPGYRRQSYGQGYPSQRPPQVVYVQEPPPAVYVEPQESDLGMGLRDSHLVASTDYGAGYGRAEGGSGPVDGYYDVSRSAKHSFAFRSLNINLTAIDIRQLSLLCAYHQRWTTRCQIISVSWSILRKRLCELQGERERLPEAFWS